MFVSWRCPIKNVINMGAFNPTTTTSSNYNYVNGEEGNNNNCLSVKDHRGSQHQGEDLVSPVGEQHDEVLMMLR